MKTTIVFDHRGRTQKGCEGPLEVRITHERKVYYVSTGVKVMKSEWKFGEVVNRFNSDKLNERLEIILMAVEDEVNDRLARHLPIDVTEIKNAVWGVRTDSDDISVEQVGAGAAPFLDWYEEQLPMLGLKHGTLKHYKTTLTRLRACGYITMWCDCTVENVYRFDAYLHGLKRKLSDAEEKTGVRAEKLGDAGVYTYHKNLMAMFRRAVKFGKLDRNPYDVLHGEFKRGVKESVEYLTEEEVAAFMNLHPMEGSTMAAARDLFVFQLYTGLSFSDALNFDIRNYKKEIVNGIDGEKTERWVSVGERVKTGVPYVSQLLPPVIDVLERYNWQVPKLQNGEYNQCLKALGLAAGIQTKMHSHLARHTFATWMLRNGVKIENLARMLGHRKIEQTMRYAKVVAQSVHDDFDMIAAKMKYTPPKSAVCKKKTAHQKSAKKSAYPKSAV